MDTCDPTVGCFHSPRDRDGDGYVDRACSVDGTDAGMAGDDCDDSDPSINPGAPEICGDTRDNNCDMRVDRADPTCP